MKIVIPNGSIVRNLLFSVGEKSENRQTDSIYLAAPPPYARLKGPPGRSNGPVAQRLEQGTHNPLVRGSNPCGPTRFLQTFRIGPAYRATIGSAVSNAIPSTMD